MTRYLSPTDYGIVAMFTVLVGLTLPFTGFKSSAAILRSYFKKDIDIPAYIFNTLCILLFGTVIVSIVYLLFSEWISAYSGFPEEWLFYVVIVSAAQFLNIVILVTWQARDKPISYGVFKILLTALNLGLSVLLIVGLGYGWEGRVMGKVVALTLFGITALGILWYSNLIKFKIVKEYISHALSYGTPLIPHAVGAFIITIVDRIFITNMVGLSETGIYTVGYEIGMIVGVLASAFNKAWTPWLFEKLNEGGKVIKRKIVKFTYCYIFIICGLALALSLCSTWFMKFFVGENFYSAVSYIFWIAFAYAFKGMYMMITNYIYYEEKNHLLMWFTLLSAGLNIILNYFLIQYYGAIGAAIATTATYLIQFLLTWILAIKISDMPWFTFWKK